MAFLTGLKSVVLAASLVVLATEGVAAVPHNGTPPRRHEMAIMDERPNFPFDPNTIETCTWWWDHEGSIPCEEMPAEWAITLEDFLAWNPSITPECGNYQLGRSYCVEAPRSAPTTTTAPVTTTKPGNGITTPTPTQSGMVTNCNKFHHIRPTTTCQGVLEYNKISLADFFRWNPAVGADCSSLWQDTYACVGVIGGTTTTKPPATTTKPANGIATPTPIQSGMVKNCNKFHLVKSTTTCQGILDYNKISLANFVKWNPAVGATCSSLWQDTYACVGVIGGTTTTKPPATTTKPANGIATPTPIQSGMVKNCNKFHLIKDTTTCAGIIDYNKITMANFLKWNTGINAQCTNLWLGTYACAGVIGGTTTTKPPATTTKPANGIVTPTPIQSGMVKNCKKFHLIKTTTTCQGIVDYNKITMANFRKWNTGINAGCTNLWLGTYACVGV